MSWDVESVRGRSFLEPTVAYACLIASSETSLPAADVPCINPVRDSGVLRYVLVNDACLKVDAHCATCRTRIGTTYLRDIGSRSTFCGFGCYRSAGEKPMLLLEGSRAVNLIAASQAMRETK
jgi:hypothetical protein